MRFAFRFRPVALIAALIVALIGILLGNWQQDRAAYKTDLQARQLARAAQPPFTLGPTIAASPDLEFRRVRVHGEFVAGWPSCSRTAHAGASPGSISQCRLK